MDIPFIIGVAIGLSLDALAVSITNGYIIKKLNFTHALRMAFFFGLFQALMPLIGWAAGSHFSSYIQKIDHWVVFCLLAFIGTKMIVESRSMDEGCEAKDCRNFSTLLLFSFVTSFDALAVGLSFGILKARILIPVAIIGIVTFILCIIGVYVGNRIGHLCENRLELVGGMVLFGIGLKILIEHLILHI